MTINPLRFSRNSLRLILWLPRGKKLIHFPHTGTKSEISAMANQDWYGHIDNKRRIQDWLTENYSGENSHISLIRRLDFVSNLMEDIKSTGAVLELGGGASDMSAYLSSRRSIKKFEREVFIVSDISNSLIDRFFPKVCTFFNVNANDFPRIIAQGESIPLDSSSCKVVIAKSVVHHFEDFKKAGNEIHRVLTKNGKFIFINDPISKISLRHEGVMGSIEDLELGFNCRTHYFRDYLSLGLPFAEIFIHVDPGFNDYLKLQLVPHWGRFSIRTLVSIFLFRFKFGRILLSILLGVPLVFECRK
jgi:SAM-dependent methyltransferase